MRCKACNAIMQENEIKWREDIGEHEDLCLKCRKEIYEISTEDLEVIDKLEKEGY